MTTALSQRWRSLIALHGLFLFIVGLLAGVFFTFSILGFVEIWPVLPRLDWVVPGDERAWMRAHTGTLMNGMALLVFAGIGGLIRLGAKGQQWLAISLLATGWGNTLGYHTSAIFGDRGLSFGGSVANSVTYLAFLTAVIAVVVVVVLSVRGVLNTRRELRGQT